jgi:PAT family beta-lactamase induction signal transducer AmpG
MENEPRRPRPFLFFFLILPYGASFGFISVAFEAVAMKRGMSASDAIEIVALAFAPHGIKFLWAPIVDKTLTKKAWYLISLVLTVLGTFALRTMNIRAGLTLKVIVVGSQVGLTLMGMACESFLALSMKEEDKGRAAGWYNAGANFGLGVGGGVALWLWYHLPPIGAAACIALPMFLCAIPLLTFDEPPFHGTRLAHLADAGRALIDVMKDLFGLAFTLFGFTGILIALSPVGAGGASNTFTALAPDWHASVEMVALVTGIIGGIVTSVGSMTGGFLADRMRRRLAYALAGALTAVSGIAMAVSPRSPATYALFTLLYSYFNGIAQASFSAFILETIGKGAAATKYNIFASLGNIAISYMTSIDAAAQARHGATGMLLTDATFTFGGIAVLLATTFLVNRFRQRPATQTV